MIIHKPNFWAYMDDNDKIHLKAYKGNDKIIRNTEQLPFCKAICEPFYAESRQHAQLIIMKHVQEEYLYYKKETK